MWKPVSGILTVVIAAVAQLDGLSTMTCKALLSDEGLKKISLVDLRTATLIWSALPNNGVTRDIQLIGKGLVMVSTGAGFCEIDLRDGRIVRTVSCSRSVETAVRLPDGRTLLGRSASPGIVTIVGTDGKVEREVSFAGTSDMRMMRVTKTGTVLFGNNSSIFEGDLATGAVVWKKNIGGTYQAYRRENGTIIVSGGYDKVLKVVDTAGLIVQRIPQTPHSSVIRPNFYGGFQILPNGHIVVSNWPGHGTGNGSLGIQLLEYDSTGTLVSYWRQDSTFVSSLHNVLILDGLDTDLLHESLQGVLKPVTGGTSAKQAPAWPNHAPSRADHRGRPIVVDRNAAGKPLGVRSPYFAPSGKRGRFAGFGIRIAPGD